MDVREIIETYLKDYGYDGLYSDVCSCELADLCPCSNWDGFIADCKPGYRHVPTQEEQEEYDFDYYMSAEK